MLILANTKINKEFQTVIPEEIRKQFNIEKDTIIEWGIDEDEKPKINFRKKVNLEDVIGIIESGEKFSSVELKRGLYDFWIVLIQFSFIFIIYLSIHSFLIKFKLYKNNK